MYTKIDVRRVVKHLQLQEQEVELLILQTPTSEARNLLTDVNIGLKQAISILWKVADDHLK